MTKFLKKILYFSILLSCFVFLAILMPATPKAKSSHLFAKGFKDSLLVNTINPRIIFVGGSNIAFGINSKVIKDSLKINPINTGYNAGIGLSYMMSNVLDKVNNGDIIILSPEYQFFYGQGLNGDISQLITLIDVPNGSNIKLSFNNYFHILKYIPEFTLSKYKITNYLIDSKLSKGIYGKLSFNKFGDSFRHWKLENELGFNYTIMEGGFDNQIISYILFMEKELQKKGASLFITFPGINKTSYLNNKSKINHVFKSLQKSDFNLIGKPSDYMYPDSLKFDSPYHPNKKGALLRTYKFVREFKRVFEVDTVLNKNKI
jgi:hypothetical protein